MTREEVYKDMESTIGLVPTFMKNLPDNTVELDWKTFKAIQLEEGVVPGKYRELIGLGISAATKCRYCTLYHTEVAKMLGATDEEISETVRFAACTSNWSAWVNGTQADYDLFKDELHKIGEFLTKKSEANVKVSV